MKEHLLPYFDERESFIGGCGIDMLVFHSTVSEVEKFADECHQYQVSAHYHIGLNGQITKLVDEEKRAWHAGKSSWRGFTGSINSRSIGIEIQNKTLGQTSFPKKQIEDLIPFAKKIIKKYNIKSENIVGHSDIAPERKPDPGYRFPWKELSKNGIGLWYHLNQKSKETNIKLLLETIGYNTDNLSAAAYAFCRRFSPEYVIKDNDIPHLVNNVLPGNFVFMKEEKFLKTLQAVAYSYKRPTFLVP